MLSLNLSFRSASSLLSTLLLGSALALTGCAAGAPSSGASGDEDESAIATAQQELASPLYQQLVGDYQDSVNAYPTLALADDGTYTLDTGIRCIMEPCPSGDNGEWAVYRSGSKYYVALFSDMGWLDWYRIGFVDGLPSSLKGAFGTSGTFLKQSYCVEWQATDENQIPQNAFYAQNVRTYQEGKDILSGMAPYFANEAINKGTCAAQGTICPLFFDPICGQVFDGPNSTYGNVCEMMVAIRTEAGDKGFAKGRWEEGACAVETGPFCGGFGNIACPGLGSCVDDPNDGCDPSVGADCGGVCACDAMAKCAAGYVWDASPEVCECVVDPAQNPCAAVRCMAGTTCEVHDGSAVCVSDGTQACGSATCGAGTVCCNALCGICTAPGMVCVQGC